MDLEAGGSPVTREEHEESSVDLVLPIEALVK